MGEMGLVIAVGAASADMASGFCTQRFIYFAYVLGHPGPVKHALRPLEGCLHARVASVDVVIVFVPEGGWNHCLMALDYDSIL